MKEMNQEHGNEESGACDFPEQERKVVVCGPEALRWRFCRGAQRSRGKGKIFLLCTCLDHGQITAYQILPKVRYKKEKKT